MHLFARMPQGHLYVEHPHWPAGASIEITVLDVKSGGAIHLRTATGDWLIDAGPAREYERVVRPYLRSRGVNRLEGLALTHGDAAHIGGAAGVLLDFHPRQVIDTAAQDRSPTHRKLIANLARDKINRRLCAANDELVLATDVTARVLFPPPDFEGDTADDQALVLQIIMAGKSRALLISDSGTGTEDFLLKHYPNLRSEILLKGQHHSGESGSIAFLDGVQPNAIIATSRDFPENERIKEDWAENVRRRGIRLFRQDETGAVTITIFSDRCELKGFLNSETFRSASR